MVYQVNALEFRIGTKGRGSAAEDMAVVKDMEEFEISFDNGVEEWTPFGTEGWARRLMTSKSMSISVSGKRCAGDVGNDYVASLAYANGADACSVLTVVFPDGAELSMPCVVNVTSAGGGSASDIGGLEFECKSDGKPTYRK
jgi:hypothetical protein